MTAREDQRCKCSATRKQHEDEPHYFMHEFQLATEDQPRPTPPTGIREGTHIHYMQRLPGGLCFAHGPYTEGMNCPQWPKCITDPQKPEYLAMSTMRSEAQGEAPQGHNCSTDDRKLPIDRPCSACSAGDYMMEHHLHCPPFRVEAGAHPSQDARLFALLLKICRNAYACAYQQGTFPGQSDPCGQCANCMADEVLGLNWKLASGSTPSPDPPQPSSAREFWQAEESYDYEELRPLDVAYKFAEAYAANLRGEIERLREALRVAQEKR